MKLIEIKLSMKIVIYLYKNLLTSFFVDKNIH